MAPFSLDYDWEGAVISLDESEVQNLSKSSDVAASLLGIASAAVSAAAPIAGVVLGVAAGWIAANKALMVAYDKGYGVDLTLPWPNVFGGNWGSVVPSSRFPHTPARMTEISVTSSAPGRIDCLYRGANLTLCYRSFDGTSWGQEQDLGGRLTTGPSAVSSFSGRIDCFYRGVGNALWYRTYSSGWGNEHSLPANMTSAPATVSRGPSLIDCFYRGTDNALWYRSFDPSSGWGHEQFQPANMTSAPSAVSHGPGLIGCFYRGTDYSIWYRMFDGQQWSNEMTIGRIVT